LLDEKEQDKMKNKARREAGMSSFFQRQQVSIRLLALGYK
jgi:hypothetical protein